MKKVVILLHLLLFSGALLQAQIGPDIIKETYRYSVKDGQELYLDKYDMPSMLMVQKPCVIFVFGGGFVSGSRDSGEYMSYFDFLVRNGYVVVSIDYRLGFSNFDAAGAVDAGGDINPRHFLEAMRNSVNIAVEDLYDATNYVWMNADKWRVDRSKIIANGSSAGAVTVLQAEYDLCNGASYASRLPEDFRYAAVISFAGAIFKYSTELEWNVKPCPIQMFHGDADNNVPYGKLTAFGAGFFGSEQIAETLRNLESPYYFYSVENAGHELAGTPMERNREEILIFLQRFVNEKQPLMIDNHVKEIGRPKVSKDFTIMDYVMANFAPQD